MEENPNEGAIREGEPPYRSNPRQRTADGVGGATESRQLGGRARRIAGLILLVLGTILVIRMGWLYAFYRPAFGEANGLRVAFFLWIGFEFALTGCWLRYRSQVAGWAAIFSVPVFFGGFYFAVSLGL